MLIFGKGKSREKEKSTKLPLKFFRLRALLILFLGFFSFVSNAQHDFYLQVMDDETEQPIPGALIFVDQQSVGVTHWNGTLTVRAACSVRITVKMMGYSDQSMLLSCQEPSPHVVRLVSVAKESATLVVSESLYGQSKGESTQSLVSVDKGDVLRKRTPDIAEALERVPGITVLDGQANIRGGSGYAYGAGTRVLMVLDDVPLITADRNDVKWNYVPIELLDRMEIVKGASAVQYGSAALNGVVHVRTIMPKEKSQGMVQTYYTGYSAPSVEGSKWWGKASATNEQAPHQIGYLFRVGEGNKKFKWLLGGAVHSASGFIQREREQRQRLSFKTIWDLGKNHRTKFGINGVAMNQRQEQTLFWLNDTTGAYTASTAMASYNDVWLNIDPWLEHFDRKGGMHQLKTRYYGSYIPRTGGYNKGLQLRQMQYRYSVNGSFGISILAGVNASRFTFTDGALGGTRVGVFGGAFTQLGWRHGKWHLTGGARAEMYGLDSLRVGPIPVGRLGASFVINDKNILRASYAQGHRFPSPAERLVRYSIDIINIYPNPDIAPEEGWGSELGYQHIWQGESVQASMDVVLFLTRYRNLIEFTFGRWGTAEDTLFGLGYKSTNVADAQIGGWEWTGELNGDWKGLEWHGLAGYTYILPVDLSLYNPETNVFKYFQDAAQSWTSSDTASYILRYRFKHMAKFNLDVQRQQWGFGVGWRYYSFMERIDPVLEFFIPGLNHYREVNRKGTHIWDFRLNYQPTDQWSCSLQIQNSFNTFYATRPAKPDAPRNISLQLTWKW
jgi:outer membrane cobalamin receptor